MANINARVKRKQIIYAVVIVVSLVVLIGGGWYWTQNFSKPPKKNTVTEPVPDMTGVISPQFDSRVQKNLNIETQAMLEAHKRNQDKLEKRLEKLEADNHALKADSISNAEELVQLRQENIELKNQLNIPARSPLAPEGEPAPNIGMPDFVAPPTHYYQGKGNATPGMTTVAPSKPPAGKLERFSFDYLDSSMNKPRYPYIPTGSFARALIIEGADANASVTGNENTVPMQFRLTGIVHMPNDKTYDLTGCFISAATYGDVSSERAFTRTRRISCDFSKSDGDALNSNPEDIIDQDIAGHVSFMGKNGIKGELVMRNGKILMYAGAAGFLDGIGEGMKSVATPAVGLGATASVGAGDVLKSGIGGGSSKAANTLSDYYIKRAEQYHPIIPIGAGNEVTIVFQDGFQLESIAEAKNKKNRNKPASVTNIQPRDQFQNNALNQVNQMLSSQVEQGGNSNEQ